MVVMSKSIFTQIIDRDISADIIFENDIAIAINDINPQAPIHILVIPKKEIRTLNNITDSDKAIVGELFTIARDLAKKFSIDSDGYRAVLNCNRHGGQTVNHIHLHILGGRQLGWPPG